MSTPIAPLIEEISSIMPNERVMPNFFKRNCRKMSEGSLRLTIINVILCGIVGNFFWYPVVFRTFGLYPGFAVITACILLNYLMCSFIYKASDEAQCNSYLGLIQKYLSPRWRNIARFTYLMDYFAAFVIGFLLCWNITAYLMYYWGAIDDSMVEDHDRLTFKSYHPWIIFLRFAVILVAYAISVPLFLKKKMNSFKWIFLGFLVVISLNILYLMFDLREFRRYYQEQKSWTISYVKPFTLDSFRYIFIFMCSYYIQSNLLTMKKDTSDPTLTRMLKTLKISHAFFLLFALAFGAYGYICLGDRFTTDLFMLRKSFPGKSHEEWYRMILALIAVFYILYMSFFILSFRNFLFGNFKANPSFYTASLGPLTISALLAFAYPKIVNFLGYNALLVCLLNGFLFPTMIMRIIYVAEKRSWVLIRALDALSVVLTGVAVLSLVALLRNDFGL